MPHSYVTSLFHLVFSTKERRQLIRADLQPRLWNYLAAIARNHGVHLIAVGGTENHVHILLMLPPDATLQDVVRTLKCNSTRLVREESRLFSWQEGYAAFSVSPSQVERVTRYIANQAEHHRKRSFDDEFVAMLEAAKIRSAGGAIPAAPEGA
jgi:REP element-mobilizing transposase RayT